LPEEIGPFTSEQFADSGFRGNLSDDPDEQILQPDQDFSTRFDSHNARPLDSNYRKQEGHKGSEHKTAVEPEVTESTAGEVLTRSEEQRQIATKGRVRSRAAVGLR